MYHVDYVKLVHKLTGPEADNVIREFLSRVNIVNECWLYVPPRGGTHSHPKFKRIECARVSWLIYKGIQPSDLMVCHKCDRGNCVNPDHLYLGNKQDNMMDAIERGQWTHYKENTRKYDANQTYIMREMYKRGYTYKQIQSILGVGAGTLYNILHRLFPYDC